LKKIGLAVIVLLISIILISGCTQPLGNEAALDSGNQNTGESNIDEIPTPEIPDNTGEEPPNLPI